MKILHERVFIMLMCKRSAGIMSSHAEDSTALDRLDKESGLLTELACTANCLPGQYIMSVVPAGLIPENYLEWLAGKRTDYYFAQLTPHTARMANIFQESFANAANATFHKMDLSKVRYHLRTDCPRQMHIHI